MNTTKSLKPSHYPEQAIQKVRVLVADEDTLVRAGIRSLLEKIPSIEVVGAVGVNPRLFTVIKAKRPDVLLIEVGTTGLSGLGTVAQVVRRYAEVSVVVFTAFATEEFATQALKAGASGYVLKRSTTAELDAAIQAAAQGHIYLCPAVASRFKGIPVEHLGNRKSPFDLLTPRQRQILKSIAESRNTKEIASLMKLSPKTVAFHRVQLMQRLGIDNVPGLVRFAIRVGLIPP